MFCSSLFISTLFNYIFNFTWIFNAYNYINYISIPVLVPPSHGHSLLFLIIVFMLFHFLKFIYLFVNFIYLFEYVKYSVYSVLRGHFWRCCHCSTSIQMCFGVFLCGLVVVVSQTSFGEVGVLNYLHAHHKTKDWLPSLVLGPDGTSFTYFLSYIQIIERSIPICSTFEH